MHPPDVKAHALELVAAGYNDCQVSRMIGIPRGTVRDWRRPTYVPKSPHISRIICPRCWRSAKPIVLTAEDYAELLALYLGDGCISEGPRTWRLRITLDSKYPRIIEETRGLLQRVFPENAVDVVDRPSDHSAAVSVYCLHLPCVFPQHAPGKKHERHIALEPWQQELVEEDPWGFIRGCIRSDGSCFVNRTKGYEYLSYDFSNMSNEIVDLFVEACGRVNVFTRRNQNPRGIWKVRINRRASVALMLAHVGRKS